MMDCLMPFRPELLEALRALDGFALGAHGLTIFIATLVGLTVGGVVGLQSEFRLGRGLAAVVALFAVANLAVGLWGASDASLARVLSIGFGISLGLRLSRPATDRSTEIVIFVSSLVLGLVGGSYVVGIAPLFEAGLVAAPAVVMIIAIATLCEDFLGRMREAERL